MDQKWIQILVILVFYQKMTSGVVRKVEEGESVEIYCKTSEKSSMVIWFRVLDSSGMEFIASFNSFGEVKSKAPIYTKFSGTKMQRENKLILNSFNKNTDSGAYSCAIIKSNEMKFGDVTRLVGEIQPVTVPAPQATTAKPGLFTTTRVCNCNSSNTSTRPGKIGPVLFCPPIILGPLAGACGLLLVLLIITILYCNKMRTRRCPHHHKRKPRTKAPEKQMMANRHV